MGDEQSMDLIIQKIKQKGLIGVLISVLRRIGNIINAFFYYACWIFPLDSKSIVLESEGDFCDQSYALYEYIKRNGYLKKYRVIWCVEHPEKYRGLENTIFVKKGTNIPSFTRAYYLARSKYHIFDHNNVISHYYKRKGQRLTYISHGCGYKKGKGGVGSKRKSVCDYYIVTSDLASERLAQFLQEDVSKARVLGYPRLDYFFMDYAVLNKALFDKYHFEDYDKIVLWMPTFRQSNNKSISEDYIVNQTGLPLFEEKEQLKEMASFLKRVNMLLVLKVHHLQAELPVFSESYDNIVILKDQELRDFGIQLYQFIPNVDALITDYSSISVDFLLLNKPIIYTLDDYEEYKKSRGLFPENAIDYMKGYHVYTIKELEESLLDISRGIDRYRVEREKSIHEHHTYQNGEASKRILEYLGITIGD